MTSTQLTVSGGGAGAGVAHSLGLEASASAAKPKVKWVDLPPDVTYLFFSYLWPKEETCNASRVCKEWSNKRYNITCHELFFQSGCEAFNSTAFAMQRMGRLRDRFNNLKAFYLYPVSELDTTDRMLTNIVLSLPQLNPQELTVQLTNDERQTIYHLKVALKTDRLRPVRVSFFCPPLRSWGGNRRPTPDFSTLALTSRSVTDITIRRPYFIPVAGAVRAPGMGREQFKELACNFPSMTALSIENMFGNVSELIDMKALLECLPELRTLRFIRKFNFSLPRYQPPGTYDFVFPRPDLFFPWSSDDCADEQEHRDLSLRHVRSIKPHEKLTCLQFDGSVDCEALHWFAGKLPALRVLHCAKGALKGTLTEEMGDGSIAALRKSSPSTREEGKR